MKETIEGTYELKDGDTVLKRLKITDNQINVSLVLADYEFTCEIAKWDYKNGKIDAWTIGENGKREKAEPNKTYIITNDGIIEKEEDRNKSVLKRTTAN